MEVRDCVYLSRRDPTHAGIANHNKVVTKQAELMQKGVSETTILGTEKVLSGGEFGTGSKHLPGWNNFHNPPKSSSTQLGSFGLTVHVPSILYDGTIR